MGNQINQSQIKNTSVPQYALVELTSVDILALSGTPIQLVAAGPTGTIIMPYLITLTGHTTGNTPYSAGSSLLFLWGTNDPSGGTFIADASVLTNADDSLALGNASIIESLSAFPLANVVDLPLMLTVSGANFTTGDATATVQVYYNIVTP